MQIKTDALRKTVAAAIEQSRKDARAKHDRDCAEYASKVEQWRAESLPLIKAQIQAMQRAVKANRPLRDTDLPTLRGSWRQGDIPTIGRPDPGKFTFTPPPNLAALAAFLDSVESETVSHTSLRAVGFRNLEYVFRLAAQLTGSEA